MILWDFIGRQRLGVGGSLILVHESNCITYNYNHCQGLLVTDLSGVDLVDLNIDWVKSPKVVSQLNMALDF